MQLNLAPQFAFDEDTWPPYQPKSFTPLLLMHYKDHPTLKESNALAKLICKGKTDDIASMAMHHNKQLQDVTDGSLKQVLDNSTMTKEITEIIAPLEKTCSSCFILIEGPPGISKSVLLKK